MIIMDMNTIVNKHLNAPVSDKTFNILSNELDSSSSAYIDYYHTSSSSSSSTTIVKKTERNPYLRDLRQNYQLNSSTESFHSSLIGDCCAGDGDNFDHHHQTSLIDKFDLSDESNLSTLTTTTTTSISTTVADTLTATNLMLIHSDTGIGFEEEDEEEAEDDDDGKDINVELDSIVDKEFRFQSEKSKLFNYQLNDHNNNNNSSSTTIFDRTLFSTNSKVIFGNKKFYI
uniref:Uncharacterized protein LOC113798626 n=1 Tax=Dermatophagoides pteronyssinus TaxID=6956 RepID=A0A6P6YI82_DERPT|nr:uncharacterized protein LOC113798626 [Dermatophagoides pteronyssinus]